MPVDVGMINGRHFLVVAGAGFDAEVVERLRDCRAGHITHLGYFWPIWRTFWEHRFPVITAEADGETIFEGQALVLVGNLPRYAVGLPIFPDARYDDGLLDVVIYPCAGRGRLVGHAINTILKRHYHRGGTLHHRCRTLRLRSPRRVPIEADGDHAGELPADISVQPGYAMFLLA
jgi:diacylglycerol kinase family enzyme